MTAQLEHANVTVKNPDETAKWMCDVFGWHIRWSGDAINNGRSVHVGNDTSYLALYAPPEQTVAGENSYTTRGGLNHLAVVLDDLDASEAKVKALGFETYSHADYEPGRRYYFADDNGIEYEIVQYD
jgi:catechol 2,3-dioxygenase-like lactoylglutathione lyase family enzyme